VSNIVAGKLPKRTNWDTVIFMTLFHVGALAALFMFSWQALVVAILLWWITASFGVGMGFHRLLTHRGYRTPKLLEYFMTVCGTLAFEGGAINSIFGIGDVNQTRSQDKALG
jgi:sn-1 stearoyl-lipid 9-desaturase